MLVGIPVDLHRRFAETGLAHLVPDVRRVDGFVELELQLRAAREVDAIVELRPDDGAEEDEGVHDERGGDGDAPVLDEIVIRPGLHQLEVLHLHHGTPNQTENALCSLPCPTNHSTMARVTTMLVNIEARSPMMRVVANPRTGPEP